MIAAGRQIPRRPSTPLTTPSMPRKKMICFRGRTLNMWSKRKLNCVYGSQTPHHRNEEPMNSFQKQIKTLSAFNDWDSYGWDWIQISQSKYLLQNYQMLLRSARRWTTNLDVQSSCTKSWKIKMDISGTSLEKVSLQSLEDTIAVLKGQLPIFLDNLQGRRLFAIQVSRWFNRFFIVVLYFCRPFFPLFNCILPQIPHHHHLFPKNQELGM